MTDPSFNLWQNPWITVEDDQGFLSDLSISQLLTDAGKYRGLFDPSPLVIVAIHRLLVAIVQDIFDPRSESDLQELWQKENFPRSKIEAFGEEFGHRFDLFSEEMPFMQSADIPLYPEKWGKGKSVGYLFHEQTAGTAVTHYNHTYDDEQHCCPICLAKGLLSIPPFATAGGAGIRPSINGVPPVYIIPGGETYFQSLVASLLTPPFKPGVRDKRDDRPWWRRDPLIGKKEEVLRVGYLHSLTFPARRVRLHPQQLSKPCTRCARQTAWSAREMTYEMGQSRPKDAAFWQDPFVAYRVREKDQPLPIRPVEGRALWREYAGLFLPHQKDEKFYRPLVIDQLEEIAEDLPFDESTPIPFQTIAFRTDMKMKFFEWQLNGFKVPTTLLSDIFAEEKISAGLEFAARVDRSLKFTFRQYFAGEGKSEHHAQLKRRLSRKYWQDLAPHFQQFVQDLAGTNNMEEPFHDWLDGVVRTAITTFNDTAEMVGNDAVKIRQRVNAISHNRSKIYKMRRDLFPRPEEVPF